MGNWQPRGWRGCTRKQIKRRNHELTERVGRAWVAVYRELGIPFMRTGDCHQGPKLSHASKLELAAVKYLAERLAHDAKAAQTIMDRQTQDSNEALYYREYGENVGHSAA